MYPDSWGPPDPCDPYRRPQLTSDSSEYKKVVENVMKTAGSSVAQIIKVCTARSLHSRSLLCTGATARLMRKMALMLLVVFY